MEELLPSAPFLSPFFRCYLSSPLMYAHCTFSGKYLQQVVQQAQRLTKQVPKDHAEQSGL
jgi:hypothetical protein